MSEKNIVEKLCSIEFGNDFLDKYQKQKQDSKSKKTNVTN